MVIDFEQVLMAVDHEPLKDPRGKKDEKTGEYLEDLTLSAVAINALMVMDAPDVKKIGGKEKLYRFKLAQKIYDETKIDLSSEDIVLIKGLITGMYTPAVVGPSWEMLECKGASETE